MKRYALPLLSVVLLASCGPSLVAPQESWGQRLFFASAAMRQYECSYNHQKAWGATSFSAALVAGVNNVAMVSDDVSFENVLYQDAILCSSVPSIAKERNLTESQSAEVAQSMRTTSWYKNAFARIHVYTKASTKDIKASATPILANGQHLPAINAIQDKLPEDDDLYLVFKNLSDIDMDNLERMEAFEINVSYGDKLYTKLITKANYFNDERFGLVPEPAPQVTPVPETPVAPK